MSPRPPVRKVWVFGALVAAGIGFADALYLAVNHYRQVIPPCTVGSCESVLTSRFAIIAGVPISLVGVAAYALIVFLLLLYIDRSNVKVLKWVAGLAAISFAVSVALVFLQLFVIRAICIYCMVSALSDTFLFVMTIPFWKITSRV
ncbi:MAG: hypothetical protein A3I39_01435 [Candidatus Yanofskybacteria bacterium RIFCSPLOWO2_02_FULL_47_9b]|uniref:Vitamin K epoxide reductase domain-containing protein n=1 Tax=Candidatus Yanofskybacteria bacterium RIFCSPLOWO2_02_FULL_47_9b TaxID=1802708 RepID=A0A1F8HAC7_9BACT|nr:MAG: hypothetical protein A3I39_01435 [Candidatus Yanofskybacteria bacterium RIFCSPLOWO2_02_FULL_47_9b]